MKLFQAYSTGTVSEQPTQQQFPVTAETSLTQPLLFVCLPALPESLHWQERTLVLLVLGLEGTNGEPPSHKNCLTWKRKSHFKKENQSRLLESVIIRIEFRLLENNLFFWTPNFKDIQNRTEEMFSIVAIQIFCLFYISCQGFHVEKKKSKIAFPHQYFWIALIFQKKKNLLVGVFYWVLFYKSYSLFVWKKHSLPLNI